MRNSKKIISIEILYKVINNVSYKLCNRCENYKPMNLDNFYKNKLNNQDGYYPYCKPCARAKSIQWANDNPEKVKEYDKRKIEGNDPIRRLRSKIAAEKNRKEGYQKEWRENNPERVKTNNEKYSNKKHIISKKEWEACKKYFNNSCAYCSMTNEEHKRLFNKQLHKEHVDARGSVYLDNCIPSCQPCNSSKHETNWLLWFKNINKENYTEEKAKLIKKWLEEDYKDYFEGYREVKKYKNRTTK